MTVASAGIVARARSSRSSSTHRTGVHGRQTVPRSEGRSIGHVRPAGGIARRGRTGHAGRSHSCCAPETEAFTDPCVGCRPVATFVLRVWLPDRPGALGQVASRIGAVRGDVVGIDILEQRRRPGGRRARRRAAGRPAGRPARGRGPPGRRRGASRRCGRSPRRCTTPGSTRSRPPPSWWGPTPSTSCWRPSSTTPAGSWAPPGWPSCPWTTTPTPTRRRRCPRRSPGGGRPPTASPCWSPTPRRPHGGWLEAFLHGSRAAEGAARGRPTGGPSDVVWAPLPCCGLALVLGRNGMAYRARERRQLAALARVVDTRMRELDDPHPGRRRPRCRACSAGRSRRPEPRPAHARRPAGVGAPQACRAQPRERSTARCQPA